MQCYLKVLLQHAIDGVPLCQRRGRDDRFQYVHVCDVNPARVPAAQVDDGTLQQRAFNITAGDQRSYREVAELKLAHYPEALFNLGSGTLDVLDVNARFDMSAARKQLAHIPHYSLEAGIAMYADWLLHHSYRRSIQMKTFLVTGTAQGIGNAINRGLAQPGNRAVLNDLKLSAELTTLASSLRERGVEVILALGDVTAEATFDGLERLDVLVNNAGILTKSLITEMNLVQWDRTLQVQLYGVFHFCKSAAILMKAQGSGVIINIVSDLGQLGWAKLCHYSAAKGAISALSKSLARELAPFGIRVNGVAPSGILTPMVARLGADYILEKAARYPLQRLGTARQKK